MTAEDANLEAEKEAAKRAELAEEEARREPGTETNDVSQQSDQTWG
jgi:hypothetical protein